MSDRNRIVWSEGLFLRPQHLQQQERYFERLVEERAGDLLRHSWGFLELDIDRELLAIGKLALRRARGVFPDGTPFSMPDEDALPTPLEVPPQTRDQTVFLGLPVRRTDALEISRTDAGAQLVRYALREWEARDVTRESSDRAALEVGCVKPHLLLDAMPLDDFAYVPLARILEHRSDRQILLDDRFMPTALDIAACPPLAGYLAELLGMIRQHADATSQLVAGTRAGGVAEMADLLRLQALNRFEGPLRHFAQVRPVHPEELYTTLLGLCGDLATLAQQNRRLPPLPGYVHGDLRASFEPVMNLVRHYLSEAGPSRVTALEVKEMQRGYFKAKVPDGALFETASFFLAAKASVPADGIRRTFPGTAKVAPTLRLQEYVEGQWAGIRLMPLSMLPPQLPFYAGYVYFELDRAHETWSELAGSGAFGIHIAGAFPDLDMKLWAMRQ